MFKHFGKIERYTDINDFLFTLSSSIKQFNQVNKNIDAIIKTQNYQNEIKRFSNDISGINQVGLLHGLDAFSHIMDLLGFDNSANNLRLKLLENAKTLVDQNIYIVCDTYYNLGLLRGDTIQLAKKILLHIDHHKTLPESCYQKVVRALNKRAQFTEYDYELAHKLDQVDISTFLPETQLKCFRYFAEYNPLFRKPFYRIPQILSQVPNQINEIPSQSLSDVFYSYIFLGPEFNQDFLIKALQQFNQQVWETKGVYNHNKFSAYQRTLKIIKNLSFLNQTQVRWDIHLEQFLFLLNNQKQEEDQLTGYFCSLFSNKMEYFSLQKRKEIFQVLKKQYGAHNKLPILEFIIKNYNYMDSSIQRETLDTFSNQKGEQPSIQAFENIHASDLKSVKLNKYRLLTLHYNYMNYEEKTLEYLRQMNMSISYWGCQFKILLISINGEKTLQFWKGQTQKMKKEIKLEFSLEIERQLNQDYIMYPKVFNNYQLEFIIWALNHLGLAPIKAAPIFYRDVAKYNELIEKVADQIIQFQLNFVETAMIWEQLNYCNNKRLVDYLKSFGQEQQLPRIVNKLQSL